MTYEYKHGELKEIKDPFTHYDPEKDGLWNAFMATQGYYSNGYIGGPEAGGSTDRRIEIFIWDFTRGSHKGWQYLLDVIIGYQRKLVFIASFPELLNFLKEYGCIFKS